MFELVGDVVIENGLKITREDGLLNDKDTHSFWDKA